jgi:GT2 family glycosyltransferase
VLLADNRPAAVDRPGAVRVIAARGPASSYHARAVAAAQASGEWLVFVDADTEPDPGLLDAYFDPPPRERTGVLAGAIEDWVAEDTLVARYIEARRKLNQATTLAHPTRPYAQTANCAVRRSAFEAVGGFPDPIRSGGDADLCWRLAAAGWELEERPGARVRHRNRARLGSLLAQVHRHGSGMGWLDRRWPGSFPPPSAREVAGRVRMVRPDAFALIDVATLFARDLGRLRPNR